MSRLRSLLLSAVVFCACQSAPDSPADGGRDAQAGGDAGLTDASAADGAGGGLGITCSGASPSFANTVHPIISTCGGERCHGGLATGAWPYAALVNATVLRDLCDPTAVLVKPGNIDKSYFLNKLTGRGMCPGTQQMPSVAAPLPQAKIQIIADWICQGAKDN